MRFRYERLYSRWATWSLRLSEFSAVLLIYSVIAYRLRYVPATGFFWLLGLVGIIGLVGLGLAFLGFNDVWQRGDKGIARALGGLAVAGLVLFPFALSGYRAVVYPRLYDISTDVDDPPTFITAEASRTPPMNPIRPVSADAARLQAGAYPDVTGRRYNGSPDRIMPSVMAVMQAKGWTVTGTRGTPGQDDEVFVEALAHTFYLDLPVDVVVRLSDEGGTTYVDMRSSSRYILHDFGDNARRITAFMFALDDQVQSTGVGAAQ
jgi:hypothetical protein